MNKVSVIFLSGKTDKKTERELKKTTLKVLKILTKKSVLVEVFLADSQTMKSLNKKFRGKNKAADVLSFEEPKNFVFPKSKNKNIGEIYINTKYKIPYSKYLLIHGLLHLFGYDHQKKNDTIMMERKERRLLKALNSNI